MLSSHIENKKHTLTAQLLLFQRAADIQIIPCAINCTLESMDQSLKGISSKEF